MCSGNINRNEITKIKSIIHFNNSIQTFNGQLVKQNKAQHSSVDCKQEGSRGFHHHGFKNDNRNNRNNRNGLYNRNRKPLPKTFYSIELDTVVL